MSDLSCGTRSSGEEMSLESDQPNSEEQTGLHSSHYSPAFRGGELGSQNRDLGKKEIIYNIYIIK